MTFIIARLQVWEDIYLRRQEDSASYFSRLRCAFFDLLKALVDWR